LAVIFISRDTALDNLQTILKAKGRIPGKLRSGKGQIRVVPEA
jgi:hypothetical protein